MATASFHESYVRTVLELGDRCIVGGGSEIPNGRTLVLSPHYDDDVIGAGGAIMTQLSKGCRVKVVYLTDGREGIPHLRDKAEVENTRRRESARALEVLGVGEAVHLLVPETHLRPTGFLVRKMIRLVRSFSPEVILIPWFFDNHVDHVEAHKVLFRMTKGLEDDVVILGYEVWTPLQPNLVIDVTRFASRKREALLCFGSQLEQVDYLRTSMALSRRRALEAGVGGYAEAFLCLPVSEYVGWIRKSGIASLRFVG